MTFPHNSHEDSAPGEFMDHTPLRRSTDDHDQDYRIQRLEETIVRLDKSVRELTKICNETQKLIAKIEGMSMLAKLIFFLIAPIVGAAIWIKNHVNLGG